MSSSTKAKLDYPVPPPNGERAYTHINRDSKTSDYKENYEHVLKEVVIENLRGMEDSATLDTTGFQLFHLPAKYTSFATDEDIYQEYYPESIELLKEQTAPPASSSSITVSMHPLGQILSHLLTYNSTHPVIRRRRCRPELGATSQARQPIVRVHVDQTTKRSIALMHERLPASDVPQLLKHRFQIINLWRPISHPALDWPLALCDYRSVDPKTDLFPITLIFSDYEGETIGVRYNENHRWKYYRGVTPEELILFKWHVLFTFEFILVWILIILLKVLTLSRMEVSLFSLLTLLSKTPRLPKERLFVNRLSCELLCSMIRSYWRLPNELYHVLESLKGLRSGYTRTDAPTPPPRALAASLGKCRRLAILKLAPILV